MTKYQQQLLIIASVAGLLWSIPAIQAAPTMQATPTPTPTAIPTVVLALSSVISTSGQLAAAQTDAWQPDSATGPFLISLAVLSLLCGLLKLIKGMMVWRSPDD